MKALSLTVTLLALTSAFACGETTDGGTSSAREWAACTLNSECTLAAKTCCGSCGKPTVDDLDGVNRRRLDEHHTDVCPEPVTCAACPTQENPDLFATCADGLCEAVDVRDTSASACTTDDDCRLRVPGCCECGGATAPTDLIAVNHADESLYAALVCDPEQACDQCAPVYPAEVEAHCAGDGHCAVRPTTPHICLLPFETGPCDAAMRVFAFVEGACVERVYGGCEGNANRFASVEQCMAACEGRPVPNGCPEGRVPQNTCVACGMIGGCGEQVDICAKSCETNDDCQAPLWYCEDGVCQIGGCI